VLNRTVSRRRFLVVGAAAAVGVAALDGVALIGSSPGNRKPLNWASPRGSLDVVDDYPLWVATKLGYFAGQGLDLSISAGPAQADSGLSQVLDGLADVGFPSPGLLASTVDRGLPLQSFFQLCAGPVFGFAVRSGSAISQVAQLAGGSVAVASKSWTELVEPLLVEAGIGPRAVRVLVAGKDWLASTGSGRTEASLAWSGLEGSPGAHGLRFLLGERWSTLPANSYVARASALADANRRKELTAFTRAVVMGLEFARASPAAAAQIVYELAPGLADSTSPALAVRAVSRMAGVYEAGRQRGQPWGVHEKKRWAAFLRIQEELGRTKRLRPEDVYTNALIRAANDIDFLRVQSDALAYPLDRGFRAAQGA